MGNRINLFIAAVVLVNWPVQLSAQAKLPAPWDSVGRILQTNGTSTSGYYRYGFPRQDLTVRIGDLTIAPGLALGSWAGFSGEPSQATLMGDLVLTGGELKGVLAELQRQHIEVTAIHNHLAGMEPAPSYVHYHGKGDAVDLATRLDRVLRVTATPRPVRAPSPAPLTIDTAMVFRALGRSGTARGNMAQLAFMLVPGTVTVEGDIVNPAMGYGTPINVQTVTPTRAVATGDFTVLADRVQPILGALVERGITATAVHSHLIGETPRVYYIHFWADGTLSDVLGGLRASLDAAK